MQHSVEVLKKETSQIHHQTASPQQKPETSFTPQTATL
jgi:hypothetical protein